MGGGGGDGEATGLSLESHGIVSGARDPSLMQTTRGLLSRPSSCGHVHFDKQRGT